MSYFFVFAVGVVIGWFHEEIYLSAEGAWERFRASRAKP